MVLWRVRNIVKRRSRLLRNRIIIRMFTCVVRKVIVLTLLLLLRLLLYTFTLVRLSTVLIVCRKSVVIGRRLVTLITITKKSRKRLVRLSRIRRMVLPFRFTI